MMRTGQKMHSGKVWARIHVLIVATPSGAGRPAETMPVLVGFDRVDVVDTSSQGFREVPTVLVKLRQVQDRLNRSLFFVPMLFVVAATALGQLMLAIDGRTKDIPAAFTATVDSARAVLSVVAGATLTFAGIAFSVSLLLISLASSQYSPRVVHGLFRDPYNKRIMGVVIGTFTYSLVVLRAVRGPLEEGGQSVVPSLSIQLAVVLGVISVLSIVAFISHAAHSMDVSQILQRVTDESLEVVRTTWLEPAIREVFAFDQPTPPDDALVVRFEGGGWVQHIDWESLLELLEPDSTMWVSTAPGRYAIPNTTFAVIAPTPTDQVAIREGAVRSVVLGETRTMQQDAGYGVRQLADVALKALSPGVNDPTTAQDALFHLGALVAEVLERDPPPKVREGERGERLVWTEAVTYPDIVNLAFDEVRVASADQPTVSMYLLEVLHILSKSLPIERREGALDALRRQAGLVVASSDLAALADADRRRVHDAFKRRFGKAAQ